MHQSRTVLLFCFRTSTDCLSDYRDTVQGMLRPTSILSQRLRPESSSCVCVCVIEIEKAVVFKRNTGIISERLHEQTKGPVFAWPQQLPLLPYLSPSCSFSLEDADSVEQSERSWLNSLTNLKHNPLFGSNASLFSLFLRWT